MLNLSIYLGLAFFLIMGAIGVLLAVPTIRDRIGEIRQARRAMRTGGSRREARRTILGAALRIGAMAAVAAATVAAAVAAVAVTAHAIGRDWS